MKGVAEGSLEFSIVRGARDSSASFAPHFPHLISVGMKRVGLGAHFEHSTSLCYTHPQQRYFLRAWRQLGDVFAFELYDKLKAQKAPYPKKGIRPANVTVVFESWVLVLGTLFTS